MWTKLSFFWLEKCEYLHCFFNVTFAEKPQMKIISLKKQKHWYLINTWSEKAFKGTVVNRALPSVDGGSLKITLTVPYKGWPIQFLTSSIIRFFRLGRGWCYFSKIFLYKVETWVGRVMIFFISENKVYMYIQLIFNYTLVGSYNSIFIFDNIHFYNCDFSKNVYKCYKVQ